MNITPEELDHLTDIIERRFAARQRYRAGEFKVTIENQLNPKHVAESIRLTNAGKKRKTVHG